MSRSESQRVRLGSGTTKTNLSINHDIFQTAPVLPYQALNNGVALAELVESHPDVVRELDTGESRLPYVILRGEVSPVKPDAGLSSQHSAVKDLKGVIQTFKLIEHKKHFSRSGFW